MHQELKKYLSQFHLLKDTEIDYSASLFEHFQLKKEGYFISEGRVCDEVAFIAKGGVRAFSVHKNGDENITCLKFEDQFATSFESFTLRQPSKIYIQAIEDCDLLIINHNKFQHLLETIPSWFSIFNLLTKQDYIEKENYIINFNNKSAKEKYLYLLTNSPKIIKRAKVGHLASYLGITQRTLTRVRKEILK